ncbi:hypothetical protein BSKO_03620 [Bryopsis sp. KO-2023]|nr:hypothetical protein BSKO_03620 [Bryopsis sp. KO-2023]
MQEEDPQLIAAQEEVQTLTRKVTYLEDDIVAIKAVMEDKLRQLNRSNIDEVPAFKQQPSTTPIMSGDG